MSSSFRRSLIFKKASHTLEKEKKEVIMKHGSFVNRLCSDPSKIEPKFRIMLKEFSFGHGRIDIIGRDSEGHFCLVEVKMRNSEVLSAKGQIRRYQTQLLRFLEMINIEMSIRALIVTPS